ncbi:MAG: hypothetical protein JXR70_02400 [Spirochaetales bacterium]|nr:hypothetical protein [Spirochaetales bacterium]
MIEKTASQLGRKDEEPNIQLALELIRDNGQGIEEIIDGFKQTDKNNFKQLKRAWPTSEPKQQIYFDNTKQIDLDTIGFQSYYKFMFNIFSRGIIIIISILNFGNSPSV